MRASEAARPICCNRRESIESKDESLRTIMVGIAGAQNRYLQNFGVLSAGLMLSMIPPLLIFIFFQKYFIRGIALTGMK